MGVPIMTEEGMLAAGDSAEGLAEGEEEEEDDAEEEKERF